jgi:hypothetical protein
MQLKDRQYLANVFNRIRASVNTINEKIIAQRKGEATIEGLLATTALEQLAMQHEILIMLAMLVTDPELTSEPLPEFPKKIIGFS